MRVDLLRPCGCLRERRGSSVLLVLLSLSSLQQGFKKKEFFRARPSFVVPGRAHPEALELGRYTNKNIAVIPEKRLDKRQFLN